MLILYGLPYCYKNVSELYTKKERILIPRSDYRRNLIYGDPLPGEEKHILIVDDYGNQKIYGIGEEIILWRNGDLKFNIHEVLESHKVVPYKNLQDIHDRLGLYNGSFDEELSEQMMAIRFVKPDATVLELGANIGRNTCVIASILTDSQRLVTFESDPKSAAVLEQNRKHNKLAFHIESCALSKNPLIQKGWNTKLHFEKDVPEGWKKVDTMCWSDVLSKYKEHTFDTLVADCEGALYYILQDEPDFLKTFHTVVIENDFTDIAHKNFVDDEFRRFGFSCVYREKGGFEPCYNRFWETWKK
jgi:FkbM family methyltransferase